MASSCSSCMSSLGLNEMERNALIQKLKKKEKKKQEKKICASMCYAKLTMSERFNTRFIKF